MTLFILTKFKYFWTIVYSAVQISNKSENASI